MVPPMITVGCAGFPVPATRYWKEFMFVEVQETHVSTPGPGTVRRWRREAPDPQSMDTGLLDMDCGFRPVGGPGTTGRSKVQAKLVYAPPVGQSKKMWFLIDQQDAGTC